MLAIQRPGTMGSTQPSDVNLPFGFAFDTTQDFLFSDPPEPPQGQPILSDDEQKLLSNFFEDMTSDNYSGATLGEGLNFTDDWLNLPPQFMGTATSFGQQPPTPLESPIQQNLLSSTPYQNIMPSSSMMPPPQSPAPQASLEQQQQQQQQHSADVLAVATLLRNGSLSRVGGSNNTHAFSNRDTGPPMGPPVGHLRHQPMAEFREDGRRMSQAPAISTDRSNTFTNAVFGTPSSQTVAARANLTAPPVDVQWGSDSNFGRHFVPQSDKETSEALEEKRLAQLNCLEVSRSAANTRPSSPVPNGNLSPVRLKTRNPATAHIKREDDFEAPPRKRRKSRATEELELEDEEFPPSSAARAGRRRKSRIDVPATTPLATKEATGRRKSAANGSAKLPRENLTEEQKRENHIKSEQKRRTLIKEGFDDLCDLVPGLKGGGFSKSTMLTMTSEWLDELLEGNERLKSQLAGLSGR